MEKRTHLRRWVLWAAALAGAGLMLLWSWPTVQKILVTMAASVAISFILSPLVNTLEKWMPRWLGITLTYGVMTGTLALVLYLVVPGLFKQGSMLIAHLPEYIKAIERVENDISLRLQDMGLSRNMLAKWQDIITGIQSGLTERAGEFVTSVPGRFSFLPELVAIPVIVFYLIKDHHAFRQFATRCIPSRYRDNVLKLEDRIKTVLYGFLQGVFTNALVVGILTTAAFVAIGVPYALLLGTLAGACEVIPYFGPYLSVIPIAIVVLIEAPQKIWWALGAVFVIQQIQGSVISPIILGGHVRLHPVSVILLMLAGLSAGGIWGMIFILPMALILREVFTFISQRAVYARTLARITRGDS